MFRDVHQSRAQWVRDGLGCLVMVGVGFGWVIVAALVMP